MRDQVTKIAPFPRFLSGKPGTTTEGRAFIATLKEDAKNADKLRSAAGFILREKDGALIWGFQPDMTPSEVEALCAKLRQTEQVSTAPEPGPSAEGWNFDIDVAPKGGNKVINGKVGGARDYDRRVHTRERIFAAGTGGVVTVSYWIPDQERWNMFSKAVPPMAWQPFVEGAPLPWHPLAG